MSNSADSKAAEAGVHPEVEEAQRQHIDHTADLDEKAKIKDFKADAIEAENAEFQMGVLECVRAYPMAATWAFIMSCTIVSLPKKLT
jgi:SP family general alpha glucoside:H+ symporter-like MFS transporter